MCFVCVNLCLQDVLQCEDSGRDLAMAVKKKARAREAAAAPGVKAATVANGAQLAAGRVVGSLCVLTAKDEDANAAMLASWVAQVGVWCCSSQVKATYDYHLGVGAYV